MFFVSFERADATLRTHRNHSHSHRVPTARDSPGPYALSFAAVQSCLWHAWSLWCLLVYPAVVHGNLDGLVLNPLVVPRAWLETVGRHVFASTHSFALALRFSALGEPVLMGRGWVAQLGSSLCSFCADALNSGCVFIKRSAAACQCIPRRRHSCHTAEAHAADPYFSADA